MPGMLFTTAVMHAREILHQFLAAAYARGGTFSKDKHAGGQGSPGVQTGIAILLSWL